MKWKIVAQGSFVLLCFHLAIGIENNTNANPVSGLYWNDLSVQTTDGAFLLHNCNGFIPDGQMCGILGPSGAGKVSFP